MKLTLLVATLLLPLCSLLEAATRDIDPQAVSDQYKINELVDVVKDGMIGERNLTDETLAACLGSFGHAPFCKCLSKVLPANQSFDSYIFFTTSSPESLGYDRLKSDDRELVDSAYQARNTCVKTLN